MNKQRLSLKLASALATALFSAFYLTSCTPDIDPGALVINEVMTNNRTGLAANDGKLHDWIELKNTSSHDLNLRGCILRYGKKYSYEFSDVEIPAGECLLIYANHKGSKDNEENKDNKDHKAAQDQSPSLPFKLKDNGDTLLLLSPSDKVLDKVRVGKMEPDQAWRRTAQGTFEASFLSTPGMENTDSCYHIFTQQLLAQRSSPLRIWEAINRRGTVHTKDNKLHAWVEVKNVSNKPIQLQGYTLQGSNKKGKQITLGDRTLAPGEILLVEDATDELKGESFVLLKDEHFVDGILLADTYPNISKGLRNKSKQYSYFNQPTPGEENTAPAYDAIAQQPTFLTKPGPYKDSLLTVTIQTHGQNVHYTTDGTQPTTASPRYTQPIRLTKTTTIRTFCAGDKSTLASPITCATYLLNTDHKLPIVSITMEDRDLYSQDTGIYVKGPNAKEESPHLGANFWMNWEKRAHIEIFDQAKHFTSECGIKIFGAYSRAREKKSFQIKFRRLYGNRYGRFDFYNRGQEDTVRAIVLRSGSQDDTRCMVRDEYFTHLMGSACPDLYVQAYRPVVLYVNAQYFGVYYIREKVDEEYIAKKMGGKPSKVDLIEGISFAKRGSRKAFDALMDTVKTLDMSQASAYQYIDERISIMSLIDYKIGEYYTGNCDVGNIRYCRSSDPNGNQKWHWIFYDLDWGFYYQTPLRFYIRSSTIRNSGQSLYAYNLLIDRILENPKGRKLFLERCAYHLNHTFQEKNALSVFNKIVTEIQPEMPRNCQRWPQLSYNSWQKHTANFREKIKERPKLMRQEIIEELHVTEKERKTYGL